MIKESEKTIAMNNGKKIVTEILRLLHNNNIEFIYVFTNEYFSFTFNIQFLQFIQDNISIKVQDLHGKAYINYHYLLS